MLLISCSQPSDSLINEEWAKDRASGTKQLLCEPLSVTLINKL